MLSLSAEKPWDWVVVPQGNERKEKMRNYTNQ